MLLAVAVLDVLHSSRVASRPNPEITASPQIAARQRLRADYGRLPLQFEANEGQVDHRVQFVSRGAGYTLFLAGHEAVLSLRPPVGDADSQVVRMQLHGARDGGAVTGEAPLSGKVNYFIGSDASKWRTDVPTYARVRYDEVYDGIDLVYYGNQEKLEYDFVVAPGADPEQIVFGFADGRKTHLDERGDLVLAMDGADLRFLKPLVYQESGAGRVPVDGRYVQRQDGIGFEVADYDRSRPLVIDPVLSYSTYLGGTHNETGRGIVVDGSGRVYVTGLTGSTNFPTVNAFQATVAPGDVLQTDAFVTKINAAGTAFEYSTYFGGNSRDFASDIAVNASGQVFVTGFTASTNFPQRGALQAYGGGDYISGGDAFIAKFTAAGNALVYSTYVGGSGSDYGQGVAIDADGNAYVTGSTKSANFPVLNAVQPGLGSTSDTNDAFAFKINAAGTALAYSTYLGGSDDESGIAIALDAGRSAYVTGSTRSTNFPVQNPFQGSNAGGLDVFVAKLDPSGSSLVFSTYLGGPNAPGDGAMSFDNGHGIAVDSHGRAYVVGQTNTGNLFPTTGPLLGPGGGAVDAFVTRFSADGTALEFSTRFGGSGDDGARGVAIDAEDRPIVIGGTGSNDFPTVLPLQAARLGPPGWYDAFVVRLTAAGTTLDFSTYLGGAGIDTGSAVAVDAAGDVYGIGTAGGPDFPVVSPILASPSPSARPAVVFKIAMDTSAPSVNVRRPNASGERLYSGTPYLIEWTAQDDGILASFDVEASSNDGISFVPVPGCSGLPGSARSCTWAAPGPVTTKGRIRVRATDRTGKSSADVSDARANIVAGSASITVTQPNTALTLVAGAVQQIKWNHNLGAQSWVHLEASRDGGTTWELLDQSFKNTASSSGSFFWTVTGPSTAQGRVRVTWANGPTSDASNVDFAITTASLTMAGPVAGTNWGWETAQTVSWNTNLGKSERVNIRASLNGGASFPILLAANVDASQRKATVTTPVTAASEPRVRLKVEWVAHEFINAVSPADFRIAMPFVTVTRPNGAAHPWTIGTSPTITWAHNLGSLENVRLELSRDGGATYPIVMLPSTKSDGTQKVAVLAPWATTHARVRITWIKNGAWFDASDADFEIR
jgi:hypothetical protein